MRCATFWPALLLLLLSSCQSNAHIYEWGDYEASVWNLTSSEGAPNIDAIIDDTTQTIEKARNSEKRIPPGMHAHLGMLLASKGQLDQAIAALESERELYPESSTFINGVLERMGAQQ